MLNYHSVLHYRRSRAAWGYLYAWSWRSRWPAAFTDRDSFARENDIPIRGAGSPSGESQPANPSTSVFAGGIELRQRFF